MRTWDFLLCLLSFIYVNNAIYKLVSIKGLHHFLWGRLLTAANCTYDSIIQLLYYVMYLSSPVLVYLGKSYTGGKSLWLVYFYVSWFQYRKDRVNTLAFPSIWDLYIYLSYQSFISQKYIRSILTKHYILVYLKWIKNTPSKFIGCWWIVYG